MDDPLSEFKSWYLKQPILTRYYLTGAFVIAILVSLGLASPYSFYYTFDTAFKQFQIWRIITSLIFQGKFSLAFIFSMFFAYFGLSKVQSQLFDRNTYADFLWLTAWLTLTLLLIASFFNLYFLGDAFIMAFIYLWCKRKPFEKIRFFFGLEVKSGYFPFFLIIFRFLIGGNIFVDTIGLLLGHLYITFKDIFTIKYQKDFLKTPNFFKKLVYGNIRPQAQMRQKSEGGGAITGPGGDIR